MFVSEASVDIATHSGFQCRRYTKRTMFLNLLVNWMLTYREESSKGFRRWRGDSWSKKEPELHWSCSLPEHWGILGWIEQSFSEFRCTSCEFFVCSL